MEKVMYPVWKPEALSGDEFREQLIGPLAEELQRQGAARFRVCVHDCAVADTQSVSLESTRPHPDAMLSLWLDCANDYERAAFDQAIGDVCDRYHAYLVVEAEPTPNTEHPVTSGEQRVFGMTQVVMLQKPDWISFDHWLSVWRNSHTFVGIGTQGTFAYRQNTVVRAVSYAAPDYAAFIEESFPEAAMQSFEAYYDEAGAKSEAWDGLIDQYFPQALDIRARMKDSPRWQINATIMQESVKRFIDVGQWPEHGLKIDCMPYSEYLNDYRS